MHAANISHDTRVCKQVWSKCYICLIVTLLYYTEGDHIFVTSYKKIIQRLGEEWMIESHGYSERCQGKSKNKINWCILSVAEEAVFNYRENLLTDWKPNINLIIELLWFLTKSFTLTINRLAKPQWKYLTSISM